MGRWRPPQPKSSPYITTEGFNTLQQELDALWPRRREVTVALAAAAAEGDRSENAEYIYRKKELAGIDRRIRYLQRRIPDLNVVPPLKEKVERVVFGAWIELEDEKGEEHRYRIVGADEFNPEKGWISVDAPMARALLKHQIDDEITVTTPKGRQNYIILTISTS